MSASLHFLKTFQQTLHLCQAYSPFYAYSEKPLGGEIKYQIDHRDIDDEDLIVHDSFNGIVFILRNIDFEGDTDTAEGNQFNHEAGAAFYLPSYLQHNFDGSDSGNLAEGSGNIRGIDIVKFNAEC